MKGFVPTPPAVVDLMVRKLFDGAPPNAHSRILDPGSGDGEFIEGIIRWCRTTGVPAPRITGIESDPAHVSTARRRFRGFEKVEIHHEDFLATSYEKYDFIIGNPPYVPITSLTVSEREEYRKQFATAIGRFDLYLLFFEQALSVLKTEGRLVLITPEKFLYVDTARPLRQMLARCTVEELHFLDESTFADLITYPLVTVLRGKARGVPTRVIRRDGRSSIIRLPDDGRSWLSAINNHVSRDSGPTLSDAVLRVSCGVATGADGVFVIRERDLDRKLKRFARPTIAGREITGLGEPKGANSMLLPYSDSGELIPEERLAELGAYLGEPSRKEALLRRTCVAHKPWYAFHETPPLSDILRPKLLCKDITREPYFIVDRLGTIVPRHSVYYIVPRNPDAIDELSEYLNSDTALEWLRAHCQRAANGFLRLQSAVLKRIPVPDDLVALSSGDQIQSELQPA